MSKDTAQRAQPCFLCLHQGISNTILHCHLKEFYLISHCKLPTDVDRNRYNNLGSSSSGAYTGSAAAPSAVEEASAAGPMTSGATPDGGAPRVTPESVAAARDARLHSLPLGAPVLEPDLDLDLAKPEVVRDLKCCFYPDIYRTPIWRSKSLGLGN